MLDDYTTTNKTLQTLRNLTGVTEDDNPSVSPSGMLPVLAPGISATNPLF